MRIAFLWCSIVLTLSQFAYADPTISDIKVFSGHPWKEVVIGYTVTGRVAEKEIDVVIELNAEDKSANKTYTTRSLTGAVLTEGRHVLRWNAAAEGVRFSSENVVFSVSIVRRGVQLWANGPYWAECNVGATTPEESGYYFWWGDTVGYKRNGSNDDWVSVADGSAYSFPMSSNGCPTFEKYNWALQSSGYIDSTGDLVAEYDAATKHRGPLWRMPTDAEWNALISNCTTTWTMQNGVLGRLVTGKGSYDTKSIFLPAAGCGSDSLLYYPGSYGFYWSSTPAGSPYYACNISFTSDGFGSDCKFRLYGMSIRPVRGFVK